MNSKKNKIALVTHDFFNAGTERLHYEIAKKLNKNNLFNIDILYYKDLSDYYKIKLETIKLPIYKINVHETNHAVSRLRSLKNKIVKIPIIRRFLLKYIDYKINVILNSLYSVFDNYDTICFINTEIYGILPKPFVFRKNQKIVLFTTQTIEQQDYNQYDFLSSKYSYEIVLIDEKKHLIELKNQMKELELIYNNKINYNSHSIPLLIEAEMFKKIYTINKNIGGDFNVAIVSRIVKDKPLLLYFSAINELLKTNKKIHFHFIGKIDPDFIKQINLNLKFLGIVENISFHEHSTNLSSTLLNLNIDLIWGTCSGDIIGYSTIEICLLGFPLILWNYGKENISNLNIINVSTSSDLAKQTDLILGDYDLMNKISEDNRNYVIENHDVKINEQLIFNVFK